MDDYAVIKLDLILASHEFRGRFKLEKNVGLISEQSGFNQM